MLCGMANSHICVIPLFFFCGNDRTYFARSHAGLVVRAAFQVGEAQKKRMVRYKIQARGLIDV